MPISGGKIVCYHANDAKISNRCQLIEANERSMFYNWGQDYFARGKALIFYDESHFCQAKDLQRCFQDIGYDVILTRIENIKETIGIMILLN